jgi:hypothetical protein
MNTWQVKHIAEVLSVLFGEIIANEPVILVFDDAHFGDKWSWQLLREVLVRLPTLSVVILHLPLTSRRRALFPTQAYLLGLSEDHPLCSKGISATTPTAASSALVTESENSKHVVQQRSRRVMMLPLNKRDIIVLVNR